MTWFSTEQVLIAGGKSDVSFSKTQPLRTKSLRLNTITSHLRRQFRVLTAPQSGTKLKTPINRGKRQGGEALNKGGAEMPTYVSLVRMTEGGLKGIAGFGKS